MKNVLITGGTGLIGSHLSVLLKHRGYKVSMLSRSAGPGSNLQVYHWDPEKGEIDPEAVTTADFIIHLAGAGIGDKRWTNRRKREIIDSRVKSGELLYETIKSTGKQPSAFISASGIGYYGSVTSEKIHTETDGPGHDFTGQVCRRWEQVALKIGDLGVRTVILRTGIVLSAEGGALSRMLPAIRLGTGSAIGSGRQFVPWIHIDDLCNIYIKAIEDSYLNGVFNSVAPSHVTNGELMKTIASVLNRPFIFPNIPALFMKILFGEMSNMLLEGSRVSAEKILMTGFAFRYPDLEGALRNLVGRS
ncbi:MAG TPA: TIGR01777 family oxidoreductase [Bacteroidales bacterium]|jgi:uncharacterized protein (TIGR01777 family)|nr:TIGR01777 family oxidoreductase [Bacteroidales bacterium]